MTSERRLRAVPEQGNRVVLYVRVSAVMGRTDEEFHSPALQTNAMRDLAARRGLLEVDVIEDIDVSGRTFERAGIRRVLAMAREREIDVVAVYDLSRLGRNTADSLRTIRELRDLGVSVVSTREQIDDSPEGQFMLGQFLGLAQLYSDQKSRDWQQVIVHRAQQGLYHGSIPPTGYRREGRMLVPDPVLAPAVREVFRRYAAGERMWHIARDWRATSGRARTHYVVIKKMLRNPAYIGRIVINGEEFPGRHEPLVDDRTWQVVQRRLAADARTPGRRLAIANPLAGVVFCDECSRHLQMHFDKERGGPVLQCRGAREIQDCRGPGVPLLSQVEKAMLARIDEEVGAIRVDMGAAHAARRARRLVAEADVRRLRRGIREVDAALTRLTKDYARRVITQREQQSASEELREERGLLAERLAVFERSTAVPPARNVVKLGKALRERWSGMTVEQKNRALRLIVREVRVARASYYRQPLDERVEVVFL